MGIVETILLNLVILAVGFLIARHYYRRSPSRESVDDLHTKLDQQSEIIVSQDEKINRLTVLVTEIFDSPELKKGTLGIEKVTAIAESTGTIELLDASPIRSAPLVTGRLGMRDQSS